MSHLWLLYFTHSDKHSHMHAASRTPKRARTPRVTDSPPPTNRERAVVQHVVHDEARQLLLLLPFLQMCCVCEKYVGCSSLKKCISILL